LSDIEDMKGSRRAGHDGRSDASLLRNSDPAAFGELYSRHVGAVYGWCRRRIEWAASDLTAETFAQAWLVRSRFRDERDGSALPWLLGIAANLLAEAARRDRIETRARKRLGLPLDLATDDGFAEAEDRLSPREALARELALLGDHERQALELRVVEGLPCGSEGDQVYDAARNTIYVDPHPVNQAPPEPHLDQGPRPGTYVLRYGNVTPIVITARQARALRKGTVGIAVRFSKRAGSVVTSLALIRRSSPPKNSGSSDGSGPSPDPGSPAFRNQILALLNSGGARVNGHKTIDGRETIEISSADGHTTYYVDPDSYDPVELDTRGTGGGVALRFRTYESLPSEGNTGLLDLRAQHPDAAVDRSAADYDAAQTRLFPHG
jgi:RNA polymerase sigma-70 factor, ECF subfamily